MLKMYVFNAFYENILTEPSNSAAAAATVSKPPIVWDCDS